MFLRVETSHKFIQSDLGKATQQTSEGEKTMGKKIKYPQVNVPFELCLDANLPENVPFPGMTQIFGHDDDTRGWQFRGTRLTGKHVGRFKIVPMNYCQPNLAAATTTIEAEYGPTPEVQWVKAFLDAFSEEVEADDDVPAGISTIGIAAAPWVASAGGVEHHYFPCVNSFGTPLLVSANSRIGKNNYWIVAVPDGE